MDDSPLGPQANWSPHNRQVAVVGLGYVGLPTACMLAVGGVKVLGVDTDRGLLDSLLIGRTRTVEPDVNALINLALHSGNLEFADEPRACSAYIMAVPTPVKPDRSADLFHLLQAVKAVARVMPRGSLLIVESTIPPGTMSRVVLPELALAGLNPEIDVLVAHCPERVLPGATMIELVNNDRVIGGLNEISARAAADLYSVFVKGAMHITDLTTAEMVKVMENSFRDVNIALANDFAKVAEIIGVDVWEAIRLANNHPRVRILQPGPGVGGHCVAVDPWFLVQLDAERTQLVRAARDVNDRMPFHCVNRLLDEVAIGEGPVVVLGLAYRADLSDTRESPALAIRKLLLDHGVQVRVHDPLVAIPPAGIVNLPLMQAAKGARAVVIATDHRDFKSMDPDGIARVVKSRVVFDTRGCIDVERWTRSGFKVLTLGRTSPARD